MKRQGKLMKMMVKIHELLKFRDNPNFNENDISQIENLDDFDDVEEALRVKCSSALQIQSRSFCA